MRQFLRDIRRLRLGLVVTFTLALSLALFGAPAEAKRLGGGGSIGMQRSVTPPSKPAQALPPSPATPTQQALPQRAPSASPAAPAQQPAMAANQAPKRSWLGPLAGIAAGLGLAWLFSQLGISESMGSLLLLLAGVALLFWLARRFLLARTPLASAPAAGGAAATLPPIPSAGAAAEPPHVAHSTNDPVQPIGSRLRDQIDEGAFLSEAKRQFIALQEAHDRQEWATISRFVTPELLATLHTRSAHDWQSGQRTDVVQLHAELVDVVQDGDQYVATVRFHGLIREEAGAVPQPFAEHWHLVKPVNGSSGWRLAGIEQEV